MRNAASSNTAEIYMQTHECNAISTALHPPKIWDRFVDDVYDILKCTHLKNFFHHIFIKIPSSPWTKKVMEN